MVRSTLSPSRSLSLFPLSLSLFLSGSLTPLIVLSQTVAEGNVGLAFGLVIAAGLATTIGSAFVFCRFLSFHYPKP